MKIVFNVDEDQIVGLLSIAATWDPDLVERNLRKAEIVRIVAEVAQTRGAEIDGWDDEVEEYEAANINGWAIAQTRRYKW